MFKRLQEIRKRKLEIRTALAGGGEVDLDAFKAELAALESEEQGIEERKKLAASINAGEIEGNPVELPKEQRNVAVEPEKMERDTLLAAPEYRNAFLKSLMGKSLNDIEKRMMTTAANSVGSVIPTQTLNKIVEKLKQVAIIYPLVTSMEIPSNVIIPVEKTTADASWVPEATASEDSDDLIENISLSAYKILKTIEISAQVEAMSIDAFENFIVTQLSNKVKMVVDAAIISGNGTGKATGILKEATPVPTRLTTGWEYDDIVNLVGALGSMYAVNAVFVMSRTTLYSRIAKIKDENKNPIFIPKAEDGFAGKILGYPVKVYDATGADTIIFGDFSYYFFNWVKPFVIEKSKEAGFRSGSTVFRALGLADGKPALVDEAFVVQVLKGTDSSSSSSSS